MCGNSCLKGYHLWVWISTLCWISHCGSGVNGTFNFYMNKEEVIRLLGLTKELYYVREGVPNTYALNFQVPIPAALNIMSFTWETLGQKPLPYSVSVGISDPVALHTPLLNIPLEGAIPTESQTLQIFLPCSGLKNAEVHIDFTLNVTAHPKFIRANDLTSVVVKRKKICLQGQPDAPVSFNSSPTSKPTRNKSNGNGHKKSPKNIHANGGNSHLTSGPSDQGMTTADVIRVNESGVDSEAPVIFVILGCSVGLIVILGAIFIVAYFRTKKGSSQSSQGFLTVDRGKGSSGSSSGDTSGTGSLFVRSESPHHYSSVTPCIVSGFNPYSNYQEPSVMCPTLVPHYSEIRGGTSSVTLISKGSSKDSYWSGGSCGGSDKMKELRVERCKVRLESVLMEGTFAKVYKGTLQQHDGSEAKVVVKTVADGSSGVGMALLLEEGLSLVGVTHPHIASVIGVAAEDRVPPFIIYADDNFRNLKRFLQRCRMGAGRVVTPQEIVHMAIQLGSGLAYLHKNNIIHRDIASRNATVDGSLRARLCDGALSRDLFPEDYEWTGGEVQSRPLKWFPPESILQSRDSTSADMWSFGVLIWELTTLAQQPFEEVASTDLFSFLKIGYRLSQPQNCPDELYEIMSGCWTWEPEVRPKWSSVLSDLQSLHAQLAQYV